MSSGNTPGNTADRTERRRRAGVHAAWIWGGVSAALLIIYLTAHAIAGYSASRSWIRAVNSALQQRDAEKAAALLTACQREMPSLAQKPFFAVWQSQLLALQQENAQKSAIFEQKISALQKILDNPGNTDSTLSLELAETARYASTAEDLERLRTLQRHCEAIERARLLENSQGGMLRLQKLSANITQMKKLRQAAEFERCSKLGEASEQLISRLLLEFEKTPEITERVISMRSEVQKELAANQSAAKIFAEQERAFQYILTGSYAEEITRRAQEFLQKYPQSSHTRQVKSLLQSLNFAAQDHTAAASAQLAKLNKCAADARDFWQKELKKIMTQAINGTVFELVMQIPQTVNGRRAHDLIKRFETHEKCSFERPEGSDIIEIRFQDVNGQMVSGKFNADGSGEVITANGRWRGRYQRGKPDGELPVARWQETLYALYWDEDLKNDFPVYLSYANQTVQELPDYVLPGVLKKRLLTAVRDTEKVLGVSAEQFIFDRKVFTFAIQHPPVFAGLVKVGNKRANYTFTPTVKSSNGSLFLLDLRQINPFILLGTMQKAPAQLTHAADNAVYLLMTITGNVNIQAEMQKFRQYSSKKKLQIPSDLPKFMQY